MLKHWPPLNTLRGFEAAARLGSFHQAANELHLTQSAISQQIRSLEAFLEQPLFFRQGRRVTLTDAGHDFYSTAQTILLQLSVGIRRLDQYRKSNQLIINTTPAFARHWLVPHLNDFHTLYPNVDIWLTTSFLPPNMAMEAIDLAIRDDVSAQDECRDQILYQDKLYPACHPSLFALDANCRVTLHGEREMDWSYWTAQGGDDVGQRNAGLNFSDPGLLLDAACNGLGIALVSKLLARQMNEKGLLRSLSTREVSGLVWTLLIHRDSENNPLTQCFLAWLLEQLPIRR